MDVGPDEDVTDSDTAVKRPRRLRSLIKWLLGIVAAIALLLVGAVVLLNTPIGQRALADRIASRTLPNGLNIRIGRIEGDIYDQAVLHDVVLSDTKGVFATIPRAEIKWNPLAWLSGRLDIDSFAARRGNLARLPVFNPGDPNKPILPGFDIAIDSFVIDNLTLAPGIAGPQPQRVDIDAAVQIADGRLAMRSRGSLGRTDRYTLSLEAEPDGDVFDIAVDFSGAAGGPVAAMLGSNSAYRAQVQGEGTWSKWDGWLVVRRDAKRLASLRLNNCSGLFHLLGQVQPGDLVRGDIARLLGNTVSVDALARIADRTVSGEYRIASNALFLSAEGALDLGDNEAENLSVEATLRAPLALGGVRLENARLNALVDGSFTDLSAEHTLRVGRLRTGKIALTGILQKGVATYDGKTWSVPVDMTAARVETGSALLDPRLVRGRASGMLRISGGRLQANDVRIAFPTASADLAVTGDLSRGTFQIDGSVQATKLELRNIGYANGRAKIDLALGGRSAWALKAAIDGRIAPISNGTLRSLAGPSLSVSGGLALGQNRPIVFNRLRLNGAKLTAMLDGQTRGGRTALTGSGRQVDFGPFTVEATLDRDGPRAVLVFADPLPTAGLKDVRVGINPSADGFDIETEGQSILGPFRGTLGLATPRGAPARIDVRQLLVSDTEVTGALTLEKGAVAGNLALSGGGLDGTIGLTPRGNRQGIDLTLRARRASFGGTAQISIRRADIRAQGVLADGSSTFTGNARGAGLSYGTLFIGRFAAVGQVTDGTGHVDASIAGRRSSSFALDLNADLAPGSIALAARGELAGKRIAMPRRALLTKLEDGGWQLARTQVSYGDGDLLASGMLGGGDTQVRLQFDAMPLSLLDLAVADIGLGGTISGVVDYGQKRGGTPQADIRVKVDDLTRSGLVLTSRPVDLSLVADLTANDLSARAFFGSAEIQRGRLQMRVANLTQGADLIERLRRGDLTAQLRFQGAAESLWRLLAVKAFDMTGPVSIVANATGTLADPRVRGRVRGDGMQVRSSLSGTNLSKVGLRGTFSGSRLALTSFSGTADNGGTVTGSGIVDLAGLGERVQGRFLQVRGPTLDIRAAARDAHLLDANGLSATVTGPLRIVSDGLGGTIAGRVTVNRASWRLGQAAAAEQLPRIPTREINLPDDTAPARASGGTWRYLINATARNRIDVRGLGLDSEWGGNITLRGTTSDPRVGGEAEVVRGAYSFAGTRFELTRGNITFDETGPIDPRLDILAETRANNISVEVRVVGNALNPEVTFSSVPALPEEEILARLLFGGSITTLSATDALQLGAAVASLRGGGGLDPINQLRSAIGLDRLRIVPADPTIKREAGVALGKNIGRRFYVEIITDGRGYSATELEFRVTSWLSLLATVSTVGRQSALVEVSRDY